MGRLNTGFEIWRLCGIVLLVGFFLVVIGPAEAREMNFIREGLIKIGKDKYIQLRLDYDKVSKTWHGVIEVLKSHPWKAGRFIVEKKFHGPSDKDFRKALRYFYAEAKWFISKSASAGLIRPTTAIPIIIVPEPVTKFEFVCWFPSLLSDFHLDSSIDLCQKKIYQKDIS